MTAGPKPYFELTVREYRPHAIKHILSASRPLVIRGRLYEHSARCRQTQHVFHVPNLEDAGQAKCYLDSGIVSERILIIHAAAVRDTRPNSIVDRGGPDCHPPAIGVAEKTYAALIDLVPRREIVDRNTNVMENFSRQGLSTHKTACKLIIFRLPRYFAPVSLFKCDGVRGNHDVAAFGELCTICLIRIAGEADDLAFSKIELPGMLVVSKDSRCWPGRAFRNKDKRLYALGFFDSIFNGLSDVGAAIHIIQYHWVQ